MKCNDSLQVVGIVSYPIALKSNVPVNPKVGLSAVQLGYVPVFTCRAAPLSSGTNSMFRPTEM